MSVVFREAKREDVPRIVALLVADRLGAERETEADLGVYLDAFDAIAADPRNELIVAEVGGAVVGTMQLTYIPGLSRRGSERLLIEAVRIDSILRGQGHGRAMIDWAVGRARARGCRLVQLTSDKTRGAALRFYTSLGFTASHEGFKLALD
ncbi:GNAT family N-acetyltransferase [Rhizohabitans arisaemae]|uniref:GNAT family N-acetyltransferase n=1 Tax=Rhizohabitans arisaemae TaxID=2720610 RepID=UPI0024B1310F|nr:GNAT family N-acetyltransferase [Rhizohabitans arisaemae]